VEASIRLARMATGRPNVVAFHGGFHGRTVAAASLTTAGTKFRSGFSPIMGGVHIAPFPYALRYGWDQETATDFALAELDYLLQTVSSVEDTAAFIIEPVLGDGGYLVTPPRFLAGLRERATRHGILLILDEVQAGVGRTGAFWGHDHAGICPDIIITAKGLASGFPISAMAAPSELMAKAWPGSQGGTYGGNAVAAAAAVATLEVIKEELLVDNARVMGDLLQAEVKELQAQFPEITDVRGIGLMQAVEFRNGDGTPNAALAVAVQNAAVDEGLLLLTCGPANNVVRIIPPLTISREEILQGVSALSAAFSRSLDVVPQPA
jgi:4-aminobutyrate aminotransferase